MRATAQQVILLTCILLTGANAGAYGPTGHWIVGEIAAANLCERAAKEIERLLDGEPLGRAGQWPDWIRRDPEWQHTRPWHYINVPDDASVESALGKPGGNVVWAVETFAAELADASLDDRRRARALRFLAHFVADVHQPLHVGRRGDRGGNAIDIVIDGKSSNLHRFWDGQQLLKAERREAGYDQAGQVESIRLLGQSRRSEWQSTDVLDWAAESKALRPEVYAFSPARTVELEPAYVSAALRITRERLAAAGFRLAGTLNGVFCSVSADG